jgi:hypothetical protein
MRDLSTKINKLLMSKYPSIRIDTITMEHRNKMEYSGYVDNMFYSGKAELVYELRTTPDFQPSVKNTEDVSNWFFVMTKMIMDEDLTIRVKFDDPHIKRTHSNYLL